MSQARLEATIANAHRICWAAAAQAERLAEQGCADDLHQIAWELRRVEESLLKGKRYARVLAEPWEVAASRQLPTDARRSST
jgi:hypothetical protein